MITIVLKEVKIISIPELEVKITQEIVKLKDSKLLLLKTRLDNT